MAAHLGGRVALITGAARGIGAATARLLVARGARVALVGLEPDRLAALATELGPSTLWAAADVTDQAAVEAGVAKTLAQFGRIDIVIANAGISTRGNVEVTDVNAMARVIDVNLTGVLRTVKATLPHVVTSRGYVLIVSSAAAFSALPGMAPYAASKAGVEHFANVLRLEMLPHGVGVGCAHMTWIDTDLVRDVHGDPSAFRRTLSRLPGAFGRVTPLDACARAFADACATRPRRVFVPRSVGVASFLRTVMNSALVQRFVGARLAAVAREEASLQQAQGKAFTGSRVGLDP